MAPPHAQLHQAPRLNGLSVPLQDTATSTAQAMVDLHHDIMFLLITISVLVLYLLFQVRGVVYCFKGLPGRLYHNVGPRAVSVSVSG